MKRKQRQKRLFVALVAAMLLLVTVPLMAAFAGEGDNAVSGSDVSASDNAVFVNSVVEPKNYNNAEDYYNDEQYNDPEQMFGLLGFYTKGPFWQYLDENEIQYAGYDAQSNSIKFVAPDTSNPKNTFLYWKDNQTGQIYYSGQTYSISIDDMKRRCINDDGSCHTWYIESIWQGDELTIDVTGAMGIQFDIPSDSENAWSDGFNSYDMWDNKTLYSDIKGTYNIRTQKATYDQEYSLQIPNDYIPVYKNYQFVEWNTMSNGTGTAYQPGDVVPITKENDVGVILYAIFDGYTIKGIVRVGWYDWTTENYDTLTFACDENGIAQELKMPAALENATARFKGWLNPIDNKTYAANEVLRNVDVKTIAEFDDWDNTYSVSLEPVWEGDISFNRTLNVYLEFSGGGNSYSPAISGVLDSDTGAITFTGDPVFTIPVSANPDNNDGFEFIGWNTSEYGNGTMYQPGVPIHIKDIEGLNQYLYLVLYATFQTDSEFTVVTENGNISNFIEKVQPSAGLVLVDDVSIDEVKMVIANLEDDVREDVIEAISQQVDITTEGEDANCQMLDISLVDIQDRGVSIQEGKILIIVSYPDIPNAKDYNYTIYHYKDGVAEPIHVEKLENGLAFYADSFSPYALVWTAEEPEEPGDDNNNSSEETQNTKDYIAIGSDGNQYTLGEIRLNITALSGTEGKKCIVLTGEKEENAQAFNITLTTRDGISVDLLKGKTLTVELNRPAISGNFSFKVYHIVDGKAVPVKLSPNTGSKIVFEASGFSPYVLSWHETISAGTDSPATGDDFTPVPYIILILLSLSAVAVTFYLNRTKIWKFIKAKMSCSIH